MKFNFKFSRHAKRRAKLYDLDLDEILKSVKFQFINQDKPLYLLGEIVSHKEKNKYPLKIVYKAEKYNITIITNYPVKKGKIK